jgi:hypothetical protein
MSSTDQDTPTAAKPGRRNRKKEPRNRKPDRPQGAKEQIGTTVAAADTAPAAALPEAAPIEAAATAETAPIEIGSPPETAPVDEAPPADTAAIAEAPVDETPPVDISRVSLQTIADAYGDYTRRSLEETRTFVEKLKGAQSLGKAVEVQTEFAKHAFEIFVTESQKIYGLHKELAKQSLKPLERMMTKPDRDQR